MNFYFLVVLGKCRYQWEHAGGRTKILYYFASVPGSPVSSPFFQMKQIQPTKSSLAENSKESKSEL